MLSSPDLAQPSHRRTWRLPNMESSLPSLRRELSPLLAGSALSDDSSYDLLLAVCEAASNAVEHAQAPGEPFFDVAAHVGQTRVTVTVRDHGRWLPATTSAFRGRGLQMMRVLADTTVVTGAGGTTVTIRSRSAAAQGSEDAQRAF